MMNKNALNGGNYGGNKVRNQRKSGVLSESAKGWSKEFNLVSWNDKEAKYDIREWDPAHEKMGKGVTLSAEELKKLRELLNELDL